MEKRYQRHLPLYLYVLYFIFCGTALAADKLTFNETVWDFGKIGPSKRLAHEFHFVNSGKADLSIKKVTPSCGCTAAMPEKTVYKPGEKGSLKVTFNPIGHSGEFYTSLSVYTNFDDAPQMLTLKADIEERPKGPISIRLPTPVITVEPQSINIGILKLGKSAIYKIVIGNSGVGELYITNMKGRNIDTGIMLNSKPIKRGKKAELTMYYNGDEKGEFDEEVVIISNDPANPEMKVRLFGKVE